MPATKPLQIGLLPSTSEHLRGTEGLGQSGLDQLTAALQRPQLTLAAPTTITGSERTDGL